VELYIKYMVCLRGQMEAKEIIKGVVSNYVIDKGLLQVVENITEEERKLLKQRLSKAGFELLESENEKLIKKIKDISVEMIHHSDKFPQEGHADYISKKLGHDYTYLSEIFADVKGISIEQYIIEHKIERIKEFILYDELDLTQIAAKLGYKSKESLSLQFEKATGLKISYFEAIREKRKQLIPKNL
jgi:AraC-like DNA-binding protein